MRFLKTLGLQEKTALLKKLEAIQANRILWTPQSEPQQLALNSDAFELFYGGQAGGGKTDLLLGLALTRHRKSIFFRREYTQISDAISRAQEILLNTDARYNGFSRTIYNVPGDRVLEFGSIQHEKDAKKYKGRPHDLKAFDEVSDFTESQYRFLIGWARSTIIGQRVRIVAAGNPPTTVEGEWVIKRWAPWIDPGYTNRAKPTELRWFAVVDKKEIEVEDGSPINHKGEIIVPKSRTFIPARLEDNIYLRDTDYKSTLQSLPEPLRSQLLYGDFLAKRSDNPWQAIPTDWIKRAQERWMKTERPADSRLERIGLDPSRGGDDRTVLAPRYDNWFDILRIYSGEDTANGPKVAALALHEWQEGSEIYLDIIGIGSSVLDSLEANSIPVMPVNFAQSCDLMDRSGKLKLRNIRAACYWKLREALDPDFGEEICLPPSETLLADLAAPQFSVTTQGIQIESKEDIKKRIGRSPDEGDAVALTFYPFRRQTRFGSASGIMR